MTTFWKWLGDWLLGTFVDKLLAAFGSMVAAGRRDQANVDKGRAEERAETLQKNQDAVSDAMKAEIEADHRHKTMPGDEAFDPDFRRED